MFIKALTQLIKSCCNTNSKRYGKEKVEQGWLLSKKKIPQRFTYSILKLSFMLKAAEKRVFH